MENGYDVCLPRENTVKGNIVYYCDYASEFLVSCLLSLGSTSLESWIKTSDERRKIGKKKSDKTIGNIDERVNSLKQKSSRAKVTHAASLSRSSCLSSLASCLSSATLSSVGKSIVLRSDKRKRREIENIFVS